MNHLYDRMAHETNLAKGATEAGRVLEANCFLCGIPATQAYMNTVCSYPLNDTSLCLCTTRSRTYGMTLKRQGTS